MKKKKCPPCNGLFPPDARNGSRQTFGCRISDCRKASKKNSQNRWLEKPVNQDYFRCSQNRDRVKGWRKSHPGYWRKKSCNKQDPLQEIITPEHTENKPDIAKLENSALHEIINAQPVVILRLIANFTRIALQDDMVSTVRRLLQLGAGFYQSTLNQQRRTP